MLPILDRRFNDEAAVFLYPPQVRFLKEICMVRSNRKIVTPW